MADVTRTLNDTYAYNGSLVDLTGTLLLSDFTQQAPGTLTVSDTDNQLDWDSGENATWNGDDATYLGSGPASSSVSLDLGLLGSVDASLSSPVDAVAWQAGGATYVDYPNGDQAQLLDGLVSSLERSTLVQTLGLTTVLNALGISSLTEYVENNAVLTFDLNTSTSFDLPVCFARGTEIMTIYGPIPVEHLEVGDLIHTVDNGLQPLLWIGQRTVSARGKFAPIRIRKGALGNDRDLLISQQHRILLRDWRINLMFGEDEVLVPAKHLLDDRNIRLETGNTVEYFHLLFDRHQIVKSNNLDTESFHPGDIAMGALSKATRSEVLELFPELGCQGWQSYGPTARRNLRHFEAKTLCVGGIQR